MRSILLIALVAVGVFCSSAAEVAKPEEKAGGRPLAAAVEASASTGTSVVTPAEKAAENVGEAESASGEVTAKPEAGAERKGLLDSILAVINSLEALIGAITGLIVALGILAPWIKKLLARLKKTKKALHEVAHSIEVYRGEKGVVDVKMMLKTNYPKETPIGSMIHEAAKEAEKKLNGG